MKILNITGYNFSDPSRVFYNGVSEAEMLNKLGLTDSRIIGNSYLGNLTDWRNYKKIIVSFKYKGFTHITNDDDSEDVMVEESIDNVIQYLDEGITIAREALRDYDSSLFKH